MKYLNLKKYLNTNVNCFRCTGIRGTQDNRIVMYNYRQWFYVRDNAIIASN